MHKNLYAAVQQELLKLSARADGQCVPVWSAIIDTPLGPPDSLLLCRFQLVDRLHCTIKCVIPWRGEAPTWESPAPQHEVIETN